MILKTFISQWVPTDTNALYTQEILPYLKAVLYSECAEKYSELYQMNEISASSKSDAKHDKTFLIKIS